MPRCTRPLPWAIREEWREPRCPPRGACASLFFRNRTERSWLLRRTPRGANAELIRATIRAGRDDEPPSPPFEAGLHSDEDHRQIRRGFHGPFATRLEVLRPLAPTFA